MSADKNDVINNIVLQSSQFLTKEETEKLKGILVLSLNGYSLVTESREIVPVNTDDIQVVQKFYVSKKVQGLSDRTLKAYMTELSYFKKKMGRNLLEVSSDDVRYYLAMCQINDHVSPVTLDNKRRYLRSFYSWCFDEEIISKNPMGKIYKVKTPKRIKKAFTDMEIEMIRNADLSMRDRAIIELLLSTGMRVGELVGLDRNSFDFNNCEVSVIGKGDKERVCYLNAKAIFALQKYFESRNDNEKAAFISLRKPYERLERGSIEKIIREIGKSLGLKMHPHKFRRTMATIALNKGVPMDSVKVMLGHEDVKTTALYAITDEKNVKLAHNKALG